MSKFAAANSPTIRVCHLASRATVLATILALVLAIVSTVCATDITIDLGPPGLRSHHTAFFNALDNTPVSGQTFSLDFVFSNNRFARLFTATNAAFADLVTLHTNGSGDLGGFLDGSGFVFDNGRNALESAQDLGAASSDNGSLSVGLFPLLSGELNRPVDFFGVHLDLTLPNLTAMHPGLVITGEEFQLSTLGVSPIDVFGVGPGRIPADIVPDTGVTWFLLGLALAGLGGFQIGSRYLRCVNSLEVAPSAHRTPADVITTSK